MLAIQHWGSKWAELTPEHAHPGVVLWGWVAAYLDRDRLPGRRVLVRFDYPTLSGPGRRGWLLIERGDAETLAGFDIALRSTESGLVCQRMDDHAGIHRFRHRHRDAAATELGDHADVAAPCRAAPTAGPVRSLLSPPAPTRRQ
jgi:hypothetical protein